MIGRSRALAPPLRPFLAVLAVATTACAGRAAPVPVHREPPPVPRVEASVCRYGDAATCAARCGAGDGYSCNNLGAMRELGEGVPRDAAAASRLYVSACEAGADAGCANARRVRGAVPVAASVPEASPCRYGDVSTCAARCLSGDGRSCTTLAAMYEIGKGVDRDAKTAWRLYLSACEAGVEEGCAHAERLRAAPAPAAAAAPDGEAAVPSSCRDDAECRRRCRRGDAPSCEALPGVHIQGSGHVTIHGDVTIFGDVYVYNARP